MSVAAPVNVKAIATICNKEIKIVAIDCTPKQVELA
jgi:putative N-acetylmannosamine-6-phosphate epimerase